MYKPYIDVAKLNVMTAGLKRSMHWGEDGWMEDQGIPALDSAGERYICHILAFFAAALLWLGHEAALAML